MKKRKVGQLIIFGLLSFVFVMFLGQQVFAEDNVNLTAGQWTYRAKYFIVDGVGCGSGSNREEESTITIIQRGGFRSSGGIAYRGASLRPNPADYQRIAIGEGIVLNNQLKSSIQSDVRTFSWEGTMSSDENTISGNATCVSSAIPSEKETVRFTMTRISRPNSTSNNTPPTTSPPSPNQTNRQPITTPPSSTQTPSNSPAPPFPQEAGPNIIRPDFR